MAKFNPRFLLAIVFIAIVLATTADVVGADCIPKNRGCYNRAGDCCPGSRCVREPIGGQEMTYCKGT
ncbi:hypothetical protein DMENIID0001_012560 [Sergentomyia squamirostris]